MSEYIPVPTTTAKDIAEQFAKSIVIILCYDPAHGMLHRTTFGVTPQDKVWAANGGDIAARALGILPVDVQFEDYRLAQARKLLVILQDALPELDGWREAVVELEDHCDEPVRLKNMTAAADQIDRFKKAVLIAIKEAETFL